VNISGLSGESLEGGALICTYCSEAASTMVALVDGANGNGGGVGWHTSASTMDGCDGRGGASGCLVGASRGLHLVIPCHITCIHGILNNTLNFTRY
jgi:hypothetical protein